MTTAHKPLHHFPLPPSPTQLLSLSSPAHCQTICCSCHNMPQLVTPGNSYSPLVTYVDFIPNHNLCKSFHKLFELTPNKSCDICGTCRVRVAFTCKDKVDKKPIRYEICERVGAGRWGSQLISIFDLIFII